MTEDRIDPEYIQARAVLLDALAALEGHRESIVVAGAQAVYLRTGSSEFLRGLQPYTTDADLALDPSSLGNHPKLEEAMRGAGFEFKRLSSNAPEPGIWVHKETPEAAATVDLIVPQGLAARGGRRGARLGPHGNRAARKIRGLEAAVVDWTVEEITALDPEDDRHFEAKVAGTAALLVAKIHKIQDRLHDEKRKEDKDAADVYRLMGVVPPSEMAQRIEALLQDDRTAEVAREALDGLRELFGRRDAPGVTMGTAALRAVVPEDTATAVFTGYVAAVGEALDG